MSNGFAVIIALVLCLVAVELVIVAAVNLSRDLAAYTQVDEPSIGEGE